MEKLIYLDTHVLVWLYAGELSLFPRETLQLLDHKSLMISPLVLLELEYLYEIGRIKADTDKIFKSLEKSMGLKICGQDFHKVIIESIKQSWTRDPFDRLIVAQALVAKAPLITKDESIRKHYCNAVWA